MDHTLRDNRFSNNSTSFNALFRNAGGLACRILVAALTLPALMSTGCQTGQFAGSKIPVPSTTLDKSRFENVRFQSLDEFGPQESKKSARPSIYSDLDRSQTASGGAAADKTNKVVAVIVTGNNTIPTHQLLRDVSTRKGRYFDPDKLKQDVDELWSNPQISRIRGPYLKYTDEGIIVTIDVVERNAITEIKFIGNRGITDKQLKKAINLTDGAPLDVQEIKMAKKKLEDFYKKSGYPKTQIEIIEGNEKDDSNVVFVIHEDELQRIWNVNFEGNSIASDARLGTQIQSKPGILKLIGGEVERDQIEQDITRLLTYYRSLGFFNARIGREIEESNDGRWLTLNFIIDEGPRYTIRNISFVGNKSFSSDDLREMLDLKPNSKEKAPKFNVATMNRDVVSLQDLYGSMGFVHSRVAAEPRFLEEPGLLDIVYIIDEGKQYVVGNINVHIDGEAITKRSVILGKLTLAPGQLIDAREIKKSEALLGRSQIFANGQTGPRPSIVVRPSTTAQLDQFAKRAPSNPQH
jgi:outer membrane protein insertion porin family